MAYRPMLWASPVSPFPREREISWGAPAAKTPHRAENSHIYGMAAETAESCAVSRVRPMKYVSVRL